MIRVENQISSRTVLSSRINPFFSPPSRVLTPCPLVSSTHPCVVSHTAQCLEKIETLVTGKEPRNVPIMAPYFAYWERRMFEALTKMIVAGVRAVHQVMRRETRNI